MFVTRNGKAWLKPIPETFTEDAISTILRNINISRLLVVYDLVTFCGRPFHQCGQYPVHTIGDIKISWFIVF